MLGGSAATQTPRRSNACRRSAVFRCDAARPPSIEELLDNPNCIDEPMAALAAALRQRHPAPGPVHHRDRGSPCASAEHRAEFARIGNLASISRKGDCWDNAVAASFFGTLAAELLDRTRCATIAQDRQAIGEHIDGLHNIEMRHSTLGHLI